MDEFRNSNSFKFNRQHNLDAKQQAVWKLLLLPAQIGKLELLKKGIKKLETGNSNYELQRIIRSINPLLPRKRKDAKLVSPSDYHNPAHCQDS